MGEEDYKKLYDSVTAQKFDIGTFDEFVVKMQTQEQRRSFYDAMAENKLDLGDYDSYEFRLAGGVKKKSSQNSPSPLQQLWPCRPFRLQTPPLRVL